MNQPAPAPKTAPATPKEKKIRRTKFQTMYPPESTITLKVKKNPKKEGSTAAKTFEAYNGSKTVGDYLKKGGKYQDLAYDVGRQLVAVTVIPAAK